MGSFSLYVNVIDSSSVPTTVDSNTASIMVNSALVAPSVTPAPGTVDQGQTSTLTSTAVTTGTAPYTYQWMEMAPGGSSYSLIIGATSDSYVFDTSGLAIGTWSFVVQVADSTGAAVNSTAVTVKANSALVAPSVTPAPGTVDQGQTSVLSNSSAVTGTSPYTYQWYSEAPGAGSYSLISDATSGSYDFITSGSTLPVHGHFSFR